MAVAVDQTATKYGAVTPVTLTLPAPNPSAVAQAAAEAAAANGEPTVDQKEKADRKRANAERLKKMAAEKRDARLAENQENLAQFDEMLARRDSGEITAEQFLEELSEGGFEDEKDFMRK